MRMQSSDDIFLHMSLADVEQIALKLSERDRALLALTLLESVGPIDLDHAPDEAERRNREIEDGTVAEISHEEFIGRVNAERGR